MSCFFLHQIHLLMQPWKAELEEMHCTAHEPCSGFPSKWKVIRNGQCGWNLWSPSLCICIWLKDFSRKCGGSLHNLFLCRNLPCDQQVWLIDSSSDTNTSNECQLTRSRVTTFFKYIPESSGKFGKNWGAIRSWRYNITLTEAENKQMKGGSRWAAGYRGTGLQIVSLEPLCPAQS